MRDIFKVMLGDFQPTGDIKKDSINLLMSHNRHRIAEHTQRVAEKAKSLAYCSKADVNLAETAGLLHDIGGIYPIAQRVETARALNINIFPEEETLPLILHQKISKEMAKDIFNVRNYNTLEAIGCHTTLKKDASIMDKILFISDKIEWDQDGTPPYLSEIEEALEVSLDLAVFTFIKYQLEKGNLKVVHPWLMEAYRDLKVSLNFLYNNY